MEESYACSMKPSVLLIVSLLLVLGVAAQINDFVVDDAGIIDANYHQQIRGKLQDLLTRDVMQAAVYTTASIGTSSIEDAALEIAHGTLGGTL